MPNTDDKKQERRKSLRYLLQWMVVALVSALTGVLLLKGFFFLYHLIRRGLEAAPLPPWSQPMLGALLVGGLIYRFEPRATGEGMPSYIESLRNHRGRLSLKVTLHKLMAGLITLSFQGSGGFVGPVGRVSAGLMSRLSRLLHYTGHGDEHTRTSAICGLAAVTGALLHAPLGGGIFAVEIIQKTNMRYRDLFPAILTSMTAVYLGDAWGVRPLIRAERVLPEILCQTGLSSSSLISALPPLLVIAVLGVTLLAAVTARSYIRFYSRMGRLFQRDRNHRILVKVLLGSLGAILITEALNRGLYGPSPDLLSGLLQGGGEVFYGNLPGGIPLFAVLLLMAAAKGLTSALTISSGLSAGFTGPAILMGSLLGAGAAHYLGFAPDSAAYFALVAAGFSGMLSSTMNVPIAAGVIAMEVFGLAFALPAGLSAVVGFQINRHNTIYDDVIVRWEDQG